MRYLSDLGFGRPDFYWLVWSGVLLLRELLLAGAFLDYGSLCGGGSCVVVCRRLRDFLAALVCFVCACRSGCWVASLLWEDLPSFLLGFFDCGGFFDCVWIRGLWEIRILVLLRILVLSVFVLWIVCVLL